MQMPNIGDPAPLFSAKDVTTGQTYNLADFANKVVLLIFSGSWCEPCQLQAPVLQDLWSTFSYSAAPPKVQFLMVSVQDQPQGFRNLVQAFGLTFPALLDPNEAIANLYGITNGPVPTLFVIDTKQKICDILVGAVGPAGALYKQIYNLLRGCGASAFIPLSEPFKIDISKWMAVVTILFGVVQDAGGVVIGPGGEPIPIDP